MMLSDRENTSSGMEIVQGTPTYTDPKHAMYTTDASDIPGTSQLQTIEVCGGLCVGEGSVCVNEIYPH